MRIITQNILKCNVKSCKNSSFPLRLTVIKSELIEAEFSPKLIKKTLERCDYPSLIQTAKDCGDESLPDVLDDAFLNDEKKLKHVHNILYQFHVVEGQMVCEACKRVYKIESGIANMLLDESEVN